jgi:hypothetical protein
MTKRSLKQKDGQFIIIAVMFIAIMIISLGTILYSTSTYYKYEPWEEYLTRIGNIKLSSQRLVELSLANFTNTNPTTSVLSENLRAWQKDLATIYPAYGIDLRYVLENDGLSYNWSGKSGISSANVSFLLDINSLGLTGYDFKSNILLNLTVIEPPIENAINITITENGQPVINLKKDNIAIDGYEIANITTHYDEEYAIIYTIILDAAETISQPVTISVWDFKGIKVQATF